MNRDIKFRAWVKETGEFDIDADDNGYMIDADELAFEEYAPISWHLISKPNFIVMQYSGLKDSEGNEIYEGDIVQLFIDFGYGRQEVRAEIIFEGGGFKAKSEAGTDFCERLPSNKILGNVYENPELLEQGG